MSVKATTWVWENSKTTGTTKLMLLAIADHADPSGYSFPGMERLARMVGVTHRQARRLVDALEKSGELVIQRNAGRGLTNRYWIRGVAGDVDAVEKGDTGVPFSPPKGDMDVPFSEPKKGTFRVEKGTSRDEKGTPMSPEPYEPKEPSLMIDDEGKVQRKIIADKLHAVGVAITPYMMDHYSDMANDYGIEAVLRGMTSAAENGKQQYMKYVDKCIVSASQGGKKGAPSAWEQLVRDEPDYLKD